MDTDIARSLDYLYGREIGWQTGKRIESLINLWKPKLPEGSNPVAESVPVDQSDVVMIAYGDTIRKPSCQPLDALGLFAEQRLGGVVSGIHILPFSPYSSDDGFSVMNYRQVNPEWGDWSHIRAISGNFRLMADLVLNHCSVQGQWFKSFLKGVDPYSNYFITVELGTDLSAVFRPRSLPLTHEFEVCGEKKMVWTTFSSDQADLDFANPEVLLEFIDILLDYVSKGVQIVRLDAVGFLWKELGTSCMHHLKTHEIIKLFRKILSKTAPNVVLVTETNVPHTENISYFGNGNDEAHMVYQFPLPPLVLNAFIRSDTSHLSSWAATLPKPNVHTTFFNFLASHDGVGLLPARDYLDERELNELLNTVKARG